MHIMSRKSGATALLAASLGLLLGGCSSSNFSLTKRIDYKSASSTPSLELPPDLTTPRYDDRYQVNSASGLAAQNANKSGRGDLLPTVPDAKIVRAGSERWLVVKATPEQSWNTVRSFWQENGFSIAVDQPTAASWKPTGPRTARRRRRTSCSARWATWRTSSAARTSATSSARASSAASNPAPWRSSFRRAAMEQVPTTTIDHAGAAFVWAVVPPNPEVEAEMLTRMMMKFGAPETAARTAVAQAASSPDKARVEKNADGSYKLVVDDQFDRAWRRVGLALDRIGFTVVDRDRSRGVYFVRFGDPDAVKSGQRKHLVEIAVLEDRRQRQARAVPDHGGRGDADQRGQRAGPGRHSRQVGDEREDPHDAQGPAQVTRKS